MKSSKKFLLTPLLLSIIFSPLFCAPKPIVREIVASNPKGNSIAISWELPKDPSPPITELLLYRSTREITAYGELKALQPVARLKAGTTFFNDTVEDFLDYYYTVISVTKDGVYEVAMSALNTTVEGVHLKVKAQSITPASKAVATERVSNDNLRAAPLPVLDIMGARGRKPVALSKKARDASKDLGVSKVSEAKPLSVHIFEEDLTSDSGGDDFLLFEVIRKTFVVNLFKEAAEQLLQFVRAGRSRDTTNRAYFYLAESYYYSGDYKTAVRYFLKVYDVWPKLVKERIDSSLALYKI